LAEPDREGHGQVAIQQDRPGRIGATHSLDFALDERAVESPRVLHAQRIDRLVLDLPRHHVCTVAIALDDARDEGRAGSEQMPERVGADTCAFGQR